MSRQPIKQPQHNALRSLTGITIFQPGMVALWVSKRALQQTKFVGNIKNAVKEI
jgi:hypothetical protein